MSAWTNLNVTSLTTWIVAVVFAVFSGSMYMHKPFYIYHEEMRLMHRFLALPAMAYKIVWPMLIAFDIASLFLYFNYVYEACASVYYITASAFALATLLGMALWAPTFIKWGSAVGGFVSVLWSFCCAGVVFGMMIASITSSTCPAVSSTYPTGAIAAALWGVQLVWFMIQLHTSWRWMYLPKAHSNYRMWLWRHKKHVAKKMNQHYQQKYGWNKSNGYGYDENPTDYSGGWERDERVDAGDGGWSDVMSNIQPLIRKPVVKSD